MRVRATPEAAAYIRSHGGVVYVRRSTAHCCHGAMTTLTAGTATPKDAEVYEMVATDELDIRYRGGIAPGMSPTELVIELQGHRRPRLVALWDGCAFKL